CLWIKNRNIRLILQPMTHPECVRGFLYENGFAIFSEAACISEKRVYCVIAAEYDGKKRVFDEADCYIGKLPESADNTDAAALYLKKQYERICKRLNALKNSGRDEAEYAFLKKITEKMEKYL
ncbi:MAG: class I SAM-dependent methyltransferase, partial [Clostridia bacterium]|nr:class I SAM-dependent methyltransferase [Clostridia bacterium]